jgi:hypothetical protein
MKIMVVNARKELLRGPYVVPLGVGPSIATLPRRRSTCSGSSCGGSGGVFTSDSGAAATDQVSAVVSRVLRRHRMGRGAHEKGGESGWPKALEAMTR